MGGYFNKLVQTIGLAGVCVASPTMADPQALWDRPQLGFMGVPGLVDMPTAHASRDADLVLSTSVVGNTQRNTLYFQITPRFSGVFRYSALKDIAPGQQFSTLYDRSFDFRYLLAEETRLRPAVTVGIQDIWGTGVFSGEYITATKTFGRLRATAGLGWGRLGSYNGFGNPLGLLSSGFDTRPSLNISELGSTGQLRTAQWFRGDAAVFGGLQYAVNDRLTLSAEYSSDAYTTETAKLGFEHNSRFNFGVSYRTQWGVDVNAAYLHGSTVGVQLSYTFNAKTPGKYPGGVDGAPVPVKPRALGSAQQLG